MKALDSAMLSSFTIKNLLLWAFKHGKGMTLGCLSTNQLEKLEAAKAA